MALRISRRVCTLGRPRALGAGTKGSMWNHSASDKSVWYALLMLGTLPSHYLRTPFRTVSLGSSLNRPSVSMLTLSRQLWHLVEREEDLVGLYAHLLCRSGKLVGSWNGASQLTLTECLSGLF